MIFYRSLAWLPFPLIYFLAWLGYLLLYYVVGYRKTVVRQNLSRAFPEKSEREITVLAKKFYRQLSQVVFEILNCCVSLSGSISGICTGCHMGRDTH